LQAYIEELLTQDIDQLGKVAADFFAIKFRPADVTAAEHIVKTVPPESHDTAEDLAKLMRKKLADMGIDYEVTIDDRQGFQCRPNHREHRLSISKYAHLQFFPAESVAMHELVHIVRAVNGEFNNIPVDKNYLPTDEGLACLVQDEFLRGPTPSAFQHAIEYLAAHYSRTHGFREVYEFLRDHGCDAENAWLRGIRQKFGLIDTSRPGGLMKSAMYFYHERLLSELSQDELIRLFIAKIPANKLPDYPHFEGIVPLEKLQHLLNT
jgi:hypothetical protein